MSQNYDIKISEVIVLFLNLKYN